MNFLFRAIQYGLMHVWPLIVLIAALKTLPIEHLEFVAILVSVATLFRPLVGLSLGRVAIRFCGVAEREGGASAGQALLGVALRLGLKISVAAAVAIVLMMVVVVKVYGFAPDWAVIGAAALFVYLFGLSELFDGLFRTLGKFKHLAVAVAASRALGIGLIALAFTLPFGLFDFLTVLVITELFCVALLFMGLRRYIGKDTTAQTLAIISEADLLRYSLPVVINAISVYFYARAMVLIVGLYEDGASVGSFEIAVQILNLPMAITIILATVLSPLVARQASATQSSERLAIPALEMGASFAVWANMLAAGFIVTVGPAILRWAAPELPDLTFLVLILAPLIVFKAYAQFLMGEIAVAIGLASVTARLTLVFGLLTILAGAILTSQMGNVGAAAAMLLVHTAGAAVSVMVFLRHSKLTLSFDTGPNMAAALAVSLPALACTLYFSANPAFAALVGTLVFLLATILIIAVSLGRYGNWIGKPLRNGIGLLAIAKQASPVGEADNPGQQRH